jgi:hypothetical protein
MKRVWITYAWDDNKDQDVDYVIQKLREAELDVKTDRWDLIAGDRLWPQIDKQISSDRETDAWCVFLSQNSLNSEPCREELAYALRRALEQRGVTFPIIGISNGSVDHSLLPSAIATRLYVSTLDEDWVERVKSGVEGKKPNIQPPSIDPYHVKVESKNGKNVIEIRPRAGNWSPFFVAIPPGEKQHVNPKLRYNNQGVMHSYMDGFLNDPWAGWTFQGAADAASPSHSYYLYCDNLPSRLVFGDLNGPMFQISL